MELQHLIDQALPSEQSCSATKYLSAQDEVPVCVGLSGDDWESEFLEQLSCGSDAQSVRKVMNVLMVWRWTKNQSQQ